MSVHITAASFGLSHLSNSFFVVKSTPQRALYAVLSNLVLLSMPVSLSLPLSVSSSVGRSETQHLAHLEEDLSRIVDALELVCTGSLCVDGNVYNERK